MNIPQLDDPVHEASGVSSMPTDESLFDAILNTQARRLAVLCAIFLPLVPLASITRYSVVGWEIYVLHGLVMCMAIGGLVLRRRLNATQIAYTFAAAMAMLGSDGVLLHGFETPMLILPGTGIVALTVFASRKATIVYGVFLGTFGTAFVLYQLVGQVGGDISLISIDDWSRLLIWGASAIFATTLSATMLADLMLAMRAAVDGEQRERRHRQLAETGAQTATERFEEFLGESPVGIIVTDERCEITVWNGSSEDMFGLPAKAVMSMTIQALLTRSDQSHPLLPRVEGVYNGNRFSNVVMQTVTGEGISNLMVSGVPLFNDAGCVKGAIFMASEITSLLSNQKQLGLPSMTEGVAALANDIRTPLMALGLSMESLDIMLESERPNIERIRDKLPVIMRQQARAAEMVEHYYENLRQQHTRAGDQDVSDLALSAVDVVRAGFNSQGIEILLDTELASEAKVRVQSVLVRQVLVNLLTNARDAILASDQAAVDPVTDAAAGRAGRISLRVEASADQVIWEVEDEAGGELPESPDLLFERGFTTKPVGEGAGLGLYISRATAEYLSGALEVEQGAAGLRFRLTLPRTLEDD